MKKRLNLLFYMLFFLCSSLHASWTPPVYLISPSIVGENATNPQIAIDLSGNAIAVWNNFDETTENIRASTYDFATNTWSSPIYLISPSVSGKFATNPQIALDSQGNAVVVWQRFDGTALNIQAATYDFASNAWSTPIYLIPTSINGRDAFNAHVSIDAAGNAVAVWERFDGISENIEAATYDFNTQTWASPVFIIVPSISGQNAGSPQLDVDPAGNAVAVWQRFDGIASNIQASTYDFGTQIWSTPINLISPSISGHDASNAQVSVDGSGNAVAVWSIFDGSTTFNIQAASYDFATQTWSAPVFLTVPIISGQSASDPQVAVDFAGNAIAVWRRFDGLAQNVQASTYDFGTQTWFLPMYLIVPSISGEDALNPHVGIDSTGNAQAIWVRTDTTAQNIQVTSYNAATHTWSAPIFLIQPSISTQDAATPQIAVNPQGNAVAVWQRFDGTANNTQGAVNHSANSLLSSITANPLEVAADGITHSTITVILRNSSGVLISGHTVTLSAENGSSLISSPSGPSDGDGQVMFTVTDTTSEIVIYSAQDTTDNITISQTAQVTFLPQPPQGFKGKRVKNKFLNKTEIVNVLFWSASTDPSVVSYSLFRSNILIATIPAQGHLVYYDLLEKCQSKTSFIYTLTAVSNIGLQSTPQSITLP